MAVRIFRSTDPSAPPHPSSTRGSMAALLRACLVTGYGFNETRTEPVGWEEPFEEVNNSTYFRSLVGTGRQLYQIDDNMPDADVAYIRAGESAPDAFTEPLGQWGKDYFGKWYNSTTSQKWTVIADEKTCYVILQSYYGNVIHGFGEFDSAIPNDPYNSFMCGHGDSGDLPSTSENGFLSSGSAGTSGIIEVHKTAIGTHAGNAKTVGINGASIVGGERAQSNPVLANNALGWYYIPMFFSCDDAQENGYFFIRGKLRGMFNPLAHRPIGDGETFIDSVTGRTMIAIHADTDNESDDEGMVIFDITGPW